MLQADELAEKLWQYVESTETGQGGDFWPLVRRVSVKLPNCDVCKMGAVLVDLPGIRDSNAARDKVAKEVNIILYIHVIL